MLRYVHVETDIHPEVYLWVGELKVFAGLFNIKKHSTNAVGYAAERHRKYHIWIKSGRTKEEEKDTVFHEVAHILLYMYKAQKKDVYTKYNEEFVQNQHTLSYEVLDHLKGQSNWSNSEDIKGLKNKFMSVSNEEVFKHPHRNVKPPKPRKPKTLGEILEKAAKKGLAEADRKITKRAEKKS